MIFETLYVKYEISENAQNLLADCQDTAIQIGNIIDNFHPNIRFSALLSARESKMAQKNGLTYN